MEPIKQDFAEFLLDLPMQMAINGTMQQALAGWDAKRFELERDALLRRELPYFRWVLLQHEGSQQQKRAHDSSRWHLT